MLCAIPFNTIFVYSFVCFALNYILGFLWLFFVSINILICKVFIFPCVCNNIRFNGAQTANASHSRTAHPSVSIMYKNGKPYVMDNAMWCMRHNLLILATQRSTWCIEFLYLKYVSFYIRSICTSTIKISYFCTKCLTRLCTWEIGRRCFCI